MIPKIIHYCWFGPNPLPLMVESWRAKLPGYELRAWTEETFDIDRLDYTREAYEAGKYAFVSDVARLYALEREGGIYLDTDMEVIRSIDDLLNDTAFVGLGEEVGLHVLAGIIAAEPHHPFIQELLTHYESRPFRLPDGTLDLTPNPQLLTSTLQAKGLRLQNRLQRVGDVTVYPADYFYTMDFVSHRVTLTPRSRTIHHYAATWQSDDPYARHLGTIFRIKRVLYRLIGQERSEWLLNSRPVQSLRRLLWGDKTRRSTTGSRS